MLISIRMFPLVCFSPLTFLLLSHHCSLPSLDDERERRPELRPEDVDIIYPIGYIARLAASSLLALLCYLFYISSLPAGMYTCRPPRVSWIQIWPTLAYCFVCVMQDMRVPSNVSGFSLRVYRFNFVVVTGNSCLSNVQVISDVVLGRASIQQPLIFRIARTILGQSFRKRSNNPNK
jgi:hypothetical protein